MNVPKNGVRIERHLRRKGRSLQNDGADGFNVIETLAITLPDTVRLVTRIAQKKQAVPPQHFSVDGQPCIYFAVTACLGIIRRISLA
jgi:hypothetical protein